MTLQDDLGIEGYSVEVVTTGTDATRRAREKAFDLILLDVMLPHKDGFDVCRELRRSGVRAGIIFLTAKTEESDKILGLEFGADDYITKPFSSRELRSRIKAVLRRTSAHALDAFQFGNTIVDFTRCTATRGNTPIDMTALEFKLLAVLIHANGRVLTREQLIDQVWGKTHVSDRVIDNHVMNLRKKIEPEPAEPRHLISVRGLGYRFNN
jgi:DNA-binding response OmpR family regulator